MISIPGSDLREGKPRRLVPGGAFSCPQTGSSVLIAGLVEGSAEGGELAEEPCSAANCTYTVPTGCRYRKNGLIFSVSPGQPVFPCPGQKMGSLWPKYGHPRSEWVFRPCTYCTYTLPNL